MAHTLAKEKPQAHTEFGPFAFRARPKHAALITEIIGGWSFVYAGLAVLFGHLRDAAIDQHLLARGRQDDMLDVIERYPSLLGIGVDEWTALVVMGNRAEVVGRSKVAFYNAKDRGDDLYYFLQDGGVFDLGTRRVVSGTRLSPGQVLGPVARFRHWLVRIGKK